jgi:hypothetical protein
MDGRPISEDDPEFDVEGHGMNLGNDNETVVSDDDVDGRAAEASDKEMVVSDESEPDVDDDKVVARN